MRTMESGEGMKENEGRQPGHIVGLILLAVEHSHGWTSMTQKTSHSLDTMDSGADFNASLLYHGFLSERHTACTASAVTEKERES